MCSQKRSQEKKCSAPPCSYSSITSFASSLLKCREKHDWRYKRPLKAQRWFIRVLYLWVWRAGSGCRECRAEGLAHSTEGKAASRAGRWREIWKRVWSATRTPRCRSLGGARVGSQAESRSHPEDLSDGSALDPHASAGPGKSVVQSRADRTGIPALPNQQC